MWIFTILRIVLWNKRTFPKLTQTSQLKKFGEEIEELLTCSSNTLPYYEELADCYIVVYGMLRFNIRLALELIKNCDFYNQNRKLVKQKIKEKMKINKKRIWRYSKGVYHHN